MQEFERLRIWPWYCWYPWYDCAPNIYFSRSRRTAGGAQNNVVIVDENIFQTRWDIPTNLDVTLTANQNACCIPGNPPPPEGNCILMTEVCRRFLWSTSAVTPARRRQPGWLRLPWQRPRSSVRRKMSSSCMDNLERRHGSGLLHRPVFAARSGHLEPGSSCCAAGLLAAVLRRHDPVARQLGWGAISRRRRRLRESSAL